MRAAKLVKLEDLGVADDTIVIYSTDKRTAAGEWARRRMLAA